MVDLKAKIISNLEFEIPPTARNCKVDNQMFSDAVKELEDEGKVTVTYIDKMLSNGEKHPHHGEIKKITLK